MNSTTTTRVTDEPATVHLSDDQAVTSIQFGTDDPITIALPLGIDMLPAAQVAWCLDLAEQLVANAARIKQVMGEVGQGWATTRREILA